MHRKIKNKSHSVCTTTTTTTNTTTTTTTQKSHPMKTFNPIACMPALPLQKPKKNPQKPTKKQNKRRWGWRCGDCYQWA